MSADAVLGTVAVLLVLLSALVLLYVFVRETSGDRSGQLDRFRGLTVDRASYEADREWWHAQANAAGCVLRVQDGKGRGAYVVHGSDGRRLPPIPYARAERVRK